MPIVLMHLLGYTSQTGTVRMCVCVCMSLLDCVCVCVLYSVCLPKSPTPPSSQKTCTVPSDIHHKLHMLFFPPSLSLLFHSPRDPELTNTQTVSDVKQWTRRAFRPLTLTVEGIECGRLWEGHASLNRQ